MRNEDADSPAATAPAAGMAASPLVPSSLTRAEFLAAVKAGSPPVPKALTVATTVFSSLPFFWSARSGVEIMQPSAAPVVVGMLSSLLLIVAPVLFALIRAPKDALP